MIVNGFSFLMLITNNPVTEGRESIGTIDLSELPLAGDDGQEVRIRVELCSTCPIDS